MKNINQYQDSSYLEKNDDWHEGDSDWKFEQMQEFLDAIQFETMADVGCGAGKITENIADRFPNATCHGYDITDNVSDFWKTRSSKATYFEKDILATDIEPYDLLILIDVFEHVEDYYSFLRKLATKSKQFIFHIPLDLFVLATLTNNYQQKRDSVGHLHYFTKGTALTALADCGYTVKKFKFTKSYANSTTALSKKLQLLRKIGNAILGSNLNSRVTGGYSLMVLAEHDAQ